jgi:hypothetical protein
MREKKNRKREQLRKAQIHNKRFLAGQLKVMFFSRNSDPAIVRSCRAFHLTHLTVVFQMNVLKIQ